MNKPIHIDISIPIYLYNNCIHRSMITKVILNHYSDITDILLKKFNARLTMTFICSEGEISKKFIEDNYKREYFYYEFDQKGITHKTRGGGRGWNTPFFHMLTEKFRCCVIKSLEKKPNISLFSGSNDYISKNFFEQLINKYDSNKKQFYMVSNGLLNEESATNRFSLDLLNGKISLEEKNIVFTDGLYYDRGRVRKDVKNVGNVWGWNDTCYNEYQDDIIKNTTYSEQTPEWYAFKIPNIEIYGGKDILSVNMKTKTSSDITPFKTLIPNYKNIFTFNSLSEKIKNIYKIDYEASIKKIFNKYK